jgi:hypothetical protein
LKSSVNIRSSPTSYHVGAADSLADRAGTVSGQRHAATGFTEISPDSGPVPAMLTADPHLTPPIFVGVRLKLTFDPAEAAETNVVFPSLLVMQYAHTQVRS